MMESPLPATQEGEGRKEEADTRGARMPPASRCLRPGEGRPLWRCFLCEQHMFPLPGIFPSSLNPASRSGRFICRLMRADISCTACYTCCTELWRGRYPPATEQSPSNTSRRQLRGPNWGSCLLYLQGDIQVVRLDPGTESHLLFGPRACL